MDAVLAIVVFALLDLSVLAGASVCVVTQLEWSVVLRFGRLDGDP